MTKFVWLWCPFVVSCPVISQSYWLLKFLGEGIFDRVPLGKSVRQIREAQKKPLPAFAVFQVLTSQNNQYSIVAHFEMECPKLLQPYFGTAYSAPLHLTIHPPNVMISSFFVKLLLSVYSHGPI